MVSCQTAPDTRPSQSTRPCSRCCGPAPRASRKVGEAAGRRSRMPRQAARSPAGARPAKRRLRAHLWNTAAAPRRNGHFTRIFAVSSTDGFPLAARMEAQACRVMPNRSWTPRVHRYSEQLVRRSERLLSGGIPVIRSEAPLWRHDQEITLLLVALNFERHFDISHVLSQVGGVSHCPSCVPETDSCAHSGL